MCLLKNGRGQVEPINARSMLDAAATAAVDRHRRPAAGRTAPQAVAGGPCRHQPESRPRLFADRDRGRGSRRRFRDAERDRHRALFRLCRPPQRLSLGICRGDLRHDRNGRDLLPGRRHLRGPGVPRPASADDPDDLVLGLRVPAVHRRILLRQARRRDFAALALGVLLRRSRGADRRAPVPAFAGAQLGAPGPARSPHHRRRLGRERRATGPGAQGPG